MAYNKINCLIKIFFNLIKSYFYQIYAGLKTQAILFSAELKVS
jgi:hypothetical protein